MEIIEMILQILFSHTSKSKIVFIKQVPVRGIL